MSILQLFNLNSLLGKTIFWGLIVVAVTVPIYKAGYNSAKARTLEEASIAHRKTQDEYEQRLEALAKQLASAKDDADLGVTLAIELQEELNNRPTIEVVREIPSIKTECNDLGSDYARLFKSIIDSKPSINIKPSD